MFETVAFAGILLGVFCRTLLPYVVKMQETVKRDEKLIWNWKYAYTALSALFTSFIVASLAFPAFNVSTDSLSLFYVFTLSFGYGWGINDAFNKAFIDWHNA